MRLKTFGRPHVVDDQGEEVALQPLPVTVLVYLAIGGPRDRQHLADLFWHNNKNRLNSLSTALNRIRADVPDGVWVRGNTLVGSDLPSDVTDLHSAIDASDFDSIARLCSAPFLGSLKLRRQSVEFEEWVLERRTELATTVELALIQHGAALHDVGEYRRAADAADAAWEIANRDGFPSPDYFGTYHRILTGAAHPSAQAVRSMADEFGVELATVAPVEIEAISEKPDLLGATAPANELFGRRDELDAIASSIAAQQVTTLVGLGGSGKTRLAAEFFASEASTIRSAHRHWVNLRDVDDPELVASAIASSLGSQSDDVALLANHLADDEPVLLVLDNFEQVVVAADVVGELAQRNRELRILVTSRVPLDIPTESIVKLDGLTSSDYDTNSPAEQLFVSSSRRAGVADQPLSSENREIVRDICRQVGGNPLALEIAGGWAQILSPSEILEALAVGSDLLASPMSGEGRSTQTVLDKSWSMLTEAEQKVLMLLATFPAGCLTIEALKVPELSIGSIGRLVRHSLVSMHVDGRITLHPLVARHARAQLDQRPDVLHDCHRILAEWCERFSSTIQKDATTASPTYSRAYGPEMPNFASAWLWAASQHQWDLLRVTVAPLRRFFSESGRVGEGRLLFDQVASELRADPSGPKPLLVRLLEALGRFNLVSGDISRARANLDEALLVSGGEDLDAQAQVLRTLGTLQLEIGEVDEAATTIKAGIDLLGDAPSTLAASLRHDLAQMHRYRGERDEAVSAARAALHSGRLADDHAVTTMSYLLLADIEVESNPDRAIVLVDEGWAIAKQASLDSLAIYFPPILGLAHLNLGDAESAEKYFTDGLDAANEMGRRPVACANHVGRAEARLLGDDLVGAADDLRTAIRLALKADIGRYLMWAAVVSCRVAAVGQPSDQRIRELLCLVLQHPATDPEAKEKANETLEVLFDEPWLTNDELVSLDEIAERALQLLKPGY